MNKEEIEKYKDRHLLYRRSNLNTYFKGKFCSVKDCSWIYYFNINGKKYCFTHLMYDIFEGRLEETAKIRLLVDEQYQKFLTSCRTVHIGYYDAVYRMYKKKYDEEKE